MSAPMCGTGAAARARGLGGGPGSWGGAGEGLGRGWGSEKWSVSAEGRFLLTLSYFSPFGPTSVMAPKVDLSFVGPSGN